MTSFIAICALLAAGAVFLIAWPLLRTPEDPEDAARPRSAIAATAIAALLPLVAFAAYFWASNWDWRTDTGEHVAPNMAQMIEQLQARLERKPDDVEGWKLLGRSATVQGDLALAKRAFGEAYTRTRGQDADAVVGYAESLVLLDEREIDGQAAPLFEQALALAPDNTRALWYGGIVAFRRGDLDLARQRWVELQEHQLPPELSQLLAEKLAEMGGGPAGEGSAPSTQAQGATVAVTIRLDPALASRVPASAPLFVIARRGDSGPPLAVVRHSAGAWPAEVTISDANAMLPGASLAGGGPIRIVARISLSGAPTASRGDLYGEVGYDFGAAKPVQVTIDRVVP